MEITSEDQKKIKRMKRTEDSLGDLWENIKCTNIRIIGVPEEEEERVLEKFWRDYSWKFSQHGKGNSQSCLRGTKSPIQDKPKEKYTKTHIKETNKDWTQRKNIKTAREKQQVTYKGNPISLTADLSAETLQTRREWQDIFKVLKGKNLQPRLLYPARISFKTGVEIKSFSDKQKLREFCTTKPALQQILKGLI